MTDRAQPDSGTTDCGRIVEAANWDATTAELMHMRLNVDGNETAAVCKDATSFPLMRPNVHSEGRALLLRASLTTVGLRVY